MAEQVAVVHLRAPAELPHRVAQLGLDERVDATAGRPFIRLTAMLQVVDGLDARVPDLLERLIRELRLERLDEPRGRLSGGVRDDVELDGRRRPRARGFCPTSPAAL